MSSPVWALLHIFFVFVFFAESIEIEKKNQTNEYILDMRDLIAQNDNVDDHEIIIK